MNLEVETAHNMYKKFSFSKNNTENFNFLMGMLEKEIRFRSGVRINSRGDIESFKLLLECYTGKLELEKVLAAEFFPDNDPPQMIIAKSETDLHEKLRENISRSKPRISGDIIFWENLKLFTCDCFNLESKMLLSKSKKPYYEIANLLLGMGYIPVDSELQLIPISPIQEK